MSARKQGFSHLLNDYIEIWGFPGGSDGRETACNAGDHRFDSWVGKIPWRRAGQPTQVFLPGESPWTEEPGALQPMGSQRVGDN